jgi:H+/Cl- antiporter ClcA
MKKIAFITGALSFSLSSLGLMFKLNHWHPADLLIVAGLGIFSLMFSPSIFKYLYDKEKLQAN